LGDGININKRKKNYQKELFGFIYTAAEYHLKGMVICKEYSNFILNFATHEMFIGASVLLFLYFK
jgi:hypothetical protein